MSVDRPNPLKILTSLRLTVALLLLSIVLVFAATIDQVHLGVWGVQEKYFRSFFIYSQFMGSGIFVPVYPGGYLLGGALIINLVAAHIARFRLSWKKSGIWLTHIGLILLLAGEGLSGMLQKDNQMRIDVGQTMRYSESFRDTELAVIDASDPGYDQVVAIPASRLVEGASIQHPLLPFIVKPVAYYPNAMLRMRSQVPNAPPSLATTGVGADIIAMPIPVTAKPDESNWPTGYVELIGPEGSLGTFLVSTMLNEPETFTYQSRTWRLVLRARRDYLPFSITLRKFTHDIYPGTDIPRDFASTILLKSDDGRDDREVRIFMNNPLRYGGRAFYQAGYANNDRTSVLQVVRNPSWRIPYISCALIVLGLVVQFGIHLFGFFFRRKGAAMARGREPATVSASAAAGGRAAPSAPLDARRFLAPAILLLALVWAGSTLIPKRNSGGFDLQSFGRLPVLADGRLKPLDTIARTSLLMFQGRQRLDTGDGRELTPEAWLLDVFFRPGIADTYRIFRIDNPDVLSLFNLGSGDGPGQVRYSFTQLESGLSELERQAQLAGPVDASARSAFQRAVVELYDRLEYYNRLKFSLGSPEKPDLLSDLSAPGGLAADQNSLETMDTFSPLRAVPPASASARVDEWESVGHSLLGSLGGGRVNPQVGFYAALGIAWRAGQADAFNVLVQADHAELSSRFAPVVRRCAWEEFFNQAEPFYTSLVLYVAAFLLAVISWLKCPSELGRAAFHLMFLAFLVATAGILTRMWLENRPPVTNLYSSALFIGWGAVGLCLVLERINRNAVASTAGSLIGFGTLVIAHNLSLSGDTLEMMRAVLDSNFWLATHVVAVTTGYASTFLAGFLAIIYLLRGILTRTLDRATADSLARMVYGIVCFATLFSFVGTVLGGIWADQSWGRFWGWDPKENGALIIVVWNAVILHCRWGGLVRQRGLMCLAVFGNIVTAWSWFGTNMLGVGLHSYGFTNAAFEGLITFVAVQLAIIGLAALPQSKWRSALA
jgi:ABC-type transport system involved in cytochrome c biogenesis permease subunit